MKFISVYINTFEFLVNWELGAHHTPTAKRYQFIDALTFSELPVSPGPCSSSDWGRLGSSPWRSQCLRRFPV